MKKGIFLLVTGAILFIVSLIRTVTAPTYEANPGLIKYDNGHAEIVWLPVIAAFLTALGIILMVVEERRRSL